MGFQVLSLKKVFYITGRLIAPLSVICAAFLIYGGIGGLYWAPADFQQGEGFRMMYIHVPTAFLSLAIYSFIFINSVVFLVWRLKIADILAQESAALGAAFTGIALVSGALWGKPMWGTWWVWDARLSSELILLFLYLGYLGLRNALADEKRAAKAAALLAVIGMIDIPIIHFSVEWWATLHQGPTLAKLSKPSIASEMLYPLLAMILALGLYYVILLMVRVRTHILEREQDTRWLQEWLKPDIKRSST